MHEVDQTTEQMVRSVLAYAENRLRMDPVPLDIGTLPAADLNARLAGLIRSSPRHPDEVLTRTRIYEHVWDERYDGLSNTLEYHVMELRKKLEAHGPRLIHTLRGRGYLFGERTEAGSLP